MLTLSSSLNFIKFVMQFFSHMWHWSAEWIFFILSANNWFRTNSNNKLLHYLPLQSRSNYLIVVLEYYRECSKFSSLRPTMVIFIYSICNPRINILKCISNWYPVCRKQFWLLNMMFLCWVAISVLFTKGLPPNSASYIKRI